MTKLAEYLSSVPFCLRKRLFIGKTLIIAAVAAVLVAVTMASEIKAIVVVFAILAYNVYDVVSVIRSCYNNELVVVKATCLQSDLIERHKNIKRVPLVGAFFNHKIDGYDCIFSVEESSSELFKPDHVFKLPVCLSMVILEERKYWLYFRKNAPVLSNSFFLGIELV